MNTIPDQNRKCHRCNFEKSCRDLVISESCQRWVKIPWTQHPLTGEKLDDYGCIDDHVFMQTLDLQRQMNLTGVEINVLRNETAKAHSEHMTMAAAAVQRSRDAIRESFREATESLRLPSEPAVPLLESH